MPPCATGIPSPSACARTKLSADATRSASHISGRRWRRPFRSADCRPRCRRKAARAAAPIRPSTTASRCRSRGRRRRRRRPTAVTSYSRQISDTSVDLPRPGAPDDRGHASGPCGQRDVFQHGPVGARVGKRRRLQSHEPRLRSRRHRIRGAGDCGRVDNTSVIRSAHTDARGSRMRRKVAIITAIRICMK